MIRCIFLGYGETTKRFQLYDEEKRRVFYSWDVVFNKTNSLRNQINGIKTEGVVNHPAVEI